MIAVTTTPVQIPLVDFSLSATSNETAIFVTWVTENYTWVTENSTDAENFTDTENSTDADYIRYFWLICLDSEDQLVETADIDVDERSYVIEGLIRASQYNVCLTTVTFQNHMDITRCVEVDTDGGPRGKQVTPPTEDTGLFLLIVIAVPIACLLLVLIIICIALILGYRRRRRRRKRPTETEMTSSSTCDSSTGNCAQNGAAPRGLNRPLPERATTTMNTYDEVVPSAPPMRDPNDDRYRNTMDPLPLQSSLSLSIYDDSLSY